MFEVRITKMPTVSNKWLLAITLASLSPEAAQASAPAPNKVLEDLVPFLKEVSFKEFETSKDAEEYLASNLTKFESMEEELNKLVLPAIKDWKSYTSFAELYNEVAGELRILNN